MCARASHPRASARLGQAAAVSLTRSTRVPSAALAWNAILSFLSNRNESVAVETKEAHESVGVAPDRKRLTRTLTAAERLLPTYQPPMGILDNDPQQPRPRPPTDQTIIGYLLGPGLM